MGEGRTLAEEVRGEEKTKKAEEKIEENKVLYTADGEGEEYMSEREDGRPCIKWGRIRTTNTKGEEENS